MATQFQPHIYTTVQIALRSKADFEIKTDNTGNQSVQYLSLLSKAWHINDKTFHQERLGKIAEVMGNLLRDLPRDRPSKTLHHEAIKSARILFQKISKEQSNDPRIVRCKLELLAFKIGVVSDVFKREINHGFEPFACKPPLERYLAEYDHEVKVDEITGEVLLQKGGKYLPWSKIRGETAPPKRDPSTDQPWLYGPDGIQNTNMFEWTQLKPYKREDPRQWGKLYIFEFCCCCESSPRFIGDHSWLRLKTPEGDIYCVGLYRPYKRDEKQNYNAPLRIKKGHLMQPDVSEFWPTPIHRIPFEITKEQFEAMKLAIETDKRDDNQIFQLVGKNCTQYVESIAKIGNIEIPTAKPFWQLLCQRYGHPNIQTGVKVTEAILPSTISSIFSTTCTFICNLSLQLAGANKIDPNICQENQKCSPHLGTLGDLFNPTKLLVHHPFTVGHETESLVLNWQAKQILELCKNPHFRKINPEKRELLMIKARFSCPPKQK